MRRFLDRYPELRVELVMSDQFGDLVEQGIDVTVRIGDLADASLVARLVGVTRRVTIGSPEYFARMGESRTARGEVRIVLADYEPKRLPIHALYPSRRFVSSKVRAFIDFLAEEFGSDPLIAVNDH